MNILLTNDDGFNSEGIKILKTLLSKYGKVVICAPKGAMSAKSCSITIGTNLTLTKEDEDVYSVNGTPADCVSLALCDLPFDFDLVVSGCNNGLNVSYDAIYSGTIGACLEALTYRKKTIAVSAPYNHVDLLTEETFNLFWNYINQNNLISNEYLLNINLPRVTPLGVTLAKEYYRKDHNYFDKSVQGEFIPLRTLDDMNDIPHDTDCYLVEHSYIAVVPLQKTYFSEDLYNKLKI